VIPFSAHAGIGRDDLAASVLALLAAGPWRAEPVPGLDPGVDQGVDQGVRDLEKNDDAG
jgi:hypothetical protein